MKEILEKSITTLNLDKNIVENLLSNNISTIFSLCNYSRIELVQLGFTNEQINEVIIKLQLIGLDLKQNHAKKNTLIENL